MKTMNVLSLFDGISCTRVALDRVGIKVNKYYASEMDKKDFRKKLRQKLVEAAIFGNEDEYICRMVLPLEEHQGIDDISKQKINKPYVPYLATLIKTFSSFFLSTMSDFIIDEVIGAVEVVNTRPAVEPIASQKEEFKSPKKVSVEEIEIKSIEALSKIRNILIQLSQTNAMESEILELCEDVLKEYPMTTIKALYEGVGND